MIHSRLVHKRTLATVEPSANIYGLTLFTCINTMNGERAKSGLAHVRLVWVLSIGLKAGAHTGKRRLFPGFRCPL